jgi:hypothetical protein
MVNDGITIYVRLAAIAQILAEGFCFQTVQQAIPLINVRIEKIAGTSNARNVKNS